MKRIIYRATILGLLVASQVRTPAQTPTTTTDPTLAAAQAQQELLDTEVKIQQDQQSLLTGSLPQSSATPNSGAFTVSGSNPFPSEKLAYDQLTTIAGKLATAVADLGGAFVLYDQTEIGNVMNYQAILLVVGSLDTQAKQISNSYNTLHDQAVDLQKMQVVAPGPNKAFAPILAAGLALGGLKTASDITGMFRTNTSIAFSSFTNDDPALIAEVAKALCANGKKVFVPAQMPLPSPGAGSALLGKLNSIQSSLFTLQNTVNTDQANLQQLSDALGAFIQDDQATQANQDQITAETDATKKKAEQVKQTGLLRVETAAHDYACSLFAADSAHPCDIKTLDVGAANVRKAEIDHFLKQLALVVTNVTALTTSLNALQTSLFGVNGGTLTLTAILRAENLNNEITTQKSSILVVKTSYLGGSYVTRQNLFSGGHLLYNGGAIANYYAFDASGVVTRSGVIVGESKNTTAKF